MDARNMQPEIGQCKDFIGPKHHDEDVTPSVVSIVITMNKCVHDQDRERYIYGCSKGDGCMNPDCWYSSIQREKKRAEAKARKERNDEQ